MCVCVAASRCQVPGASQNFRSPPIYCSDTSGVSGDAEAQSVCVSGDKIETRCVSGDEASGCLKFFPCTAAVAAATRGHSRLPAQADGLGATVGEALVSASRRTARWTGQREPVPTVPRSLLWDPR